MKHKIALITGGYSGEAKVSYNSSKNVAANLDASKYDVYVIDIRKDGWFYIDGAGVEQEVDRKDFSISVEGNQIKFDLAFIILHGTPGEDGKLQGYFDMIGLPYTSCNAATSSLTFNKRYTVAVAAFAGIKVARSVHLIKGMEWSADKISTELSMPVFVKPNNGGSSIGMSKVNDQKDLQQAIEKAFREDTQVLVEEMIQGREFTIGVYRHKGAVKTLPITEVKAHAGQSFFDFEAKYQGKSDEITPAEMPDPWRRKIETAAANIYEVFNCSGVIRIDFIYNEAEQSPYMLEINTVPGQSDASIIPQQVRAAGMNLMEFYGGLIDETLAGN
jgi:D-alanine-D-alanine ligase